ncbi:hypothetical protein IGI04_015556, partial [Brassica rapa subsp. trilocularis]
GNLVPALTLDYNRTHAITVGKRTRTSWGCVRQLSRDYQPLPSQLSICSGASVTKVNNGTQLNLLVMVNSQIHLSEMKPGRSKQVVFTRLLWFWGSRMLRKEES